MNHRLVQRVAQLLPNHVLQQQVLTLYQILVSAMVTVFQLVVADLPFRHGSNTLIVFSGIRLSELLIHLNLLGTSGLPLVIGVERVLGLVH